MTINTDDILNSILESISRIDYIKPESIPDIDLYMDQVTTFMEAQLKSSKRYEDDKILTKTMINNYAKNNLLPPPVKKKYSKEHILVLIFIYYFKGFLAIKDIESILRPITNRFFNNDDTFNMTTLYEEVCLLEKAQIDSMKEELAELYKISENSCQGARDEDKEYLQLFMFICSLSFDVYVKKLLIEKLIDELPAGKGPGKSK